MLGRSIAGLRAAGQGRRRHVVRASTAAVLLGLLGTVPTALGSTISGHLYAFGDNQWGQLGNPTNNMNHEENVPNPSPTLVVMPGETGPVVQAAAGGDHSLAVTSTGQLYAFGGNYYGQVGNEINNLKEEANPFPALVSLPGQTGPVAQAAAGRYHSLAVTSTGQLYAFGDNNWGQLGNSTNTGWTEAANPTPQLVALPGATGPVTQAAGGAYHSLAVTSTGQLYAFGENQWGQLGNPTNDGSDSSPISPNPTPTLVTLPDAAGPVTQIAAGAWFSLAVTSAGQLYAFGENRFGELGSPINDRTEEPNSTPTLVTLPGASGQVIQVAAGFAHSLALTSSGQLYAFGENACGQLGNPTNNRTEEPNPTPRTVTLPGANGRIIRIAAGGSYSLALTSSGQLYAFGCNFYGELGTAPSKEKLAPHPAPMIVTIVSGANIDTMATGAWSNHTLVVAAHLAIASVSLPSAETGKPYCAALQGTGGAPPYSWAAEGLPEGLSINQATGAISGTPTAAGTYTPTITLSDGYGIHASIVLSITIKGAEETPVVLPAPEQLPQPSPEIEAPPFPMPNSAPPLLVRNVRQSSSRWREGNPLAQISHKKNVGTVFSFVLNEQATVHFGFIQLAGRHHSRDCTRLAQNTLHQRGCTIRVPRGAFSVNGLEGTNNVAFAGRISSAKKLNPGRYEVAITATNAVSQRSAPALLRFTIMR